MDFTPYCILADAISELPNSTLLGLSSTVHIYSLHVPKHIHTFVSLHMETFGTGIGIHFHECSSWLLRSPQSCTATRGDTSLSRPLEATAAVLWERGVSSSTQANRASETCSGYSAGMAAFLLAAQKYCPFLSTPHMFSSS